MFLLQTNGSPMTVKSTSKGLCQLSTIDYIFIKTSLLTLNLRGKIMAHILKLLLMMFGAVADLLSFRARHLILTKAEYASTIKVKLMSN
jgi:hypothetical protein